MSHFYYDAESFYHVKCTKTKTKTEATAYFKIWFLKAQQFTPLFQVENNLESRQIDNEFQVTKNINEYPTPSPTASREQTCDSEDLNLEVVDDFDVLHNQGIAGANVYLEAFSANFLEKHILSENIKIHRDQLPPPPKA
ncbi:hypothetical protein GcC1_188024 [Golovinomyces cichoracearum]|uniref:Uncharacterized protein n=1 Tax=Golovinomyces cichoracearum TaxID=62708 RepID=A0A420HJB3_9PEZI|nr:hypothetical protein GcC1_188024 [Golovinomyces cichoracearum]